MFRSLASLLVASVALAADPPPYPATVTLTPVTVQDGTAEWVVVKMVPVQKAVEVEVIKDGQKVKELRTVTEYVSELKALRQPLKEWKATGNDGKQIAADDLAKRLAGGGVVVMFGGRLDVELRKAFKDGTVFLDQTPPRPEK